MLVFNPLLATTSLVLTSIGVQALPTTPTSSESIAKRSTVSNGVTCYYSCPAFPPNFFDPNGSGSGLISEGNYFCSYFNPDYGVTSCEYNEATGEFSFGAPGCPPNAAGPNCGIGPGDGRFKRSYLPRKRSPAEEAIQRRQYQPGKVKTFRRQPL